MTLTIAARFIQRPSDLSSLCRQTLQFIDGGPQWLQGAIQSQTSRYHFADESGLIDGVQKGLHGTPYAWLPVVGIRVSPIKLMTLGSNRLGALAEAEAGSQTPDVQAQVQRILSDSAIIRAPDMPALLEQLGVGTVPLLAILDLPEALALVQLAGQLADTQTQARREEAARFALEHARGPLEFCDYYRFHLERPTDSTSGPEARTDTARHVMQALLPHLFDLLQGPQLSGLPAPQEVSQAISDHLARGRTLGFSRISLALQQLARAIGPLDTSTDIERAVQHHMRAAMDVLMHHEVRSGALAQDGSSARFRIPHEDRPLVVAVDNGLVTIADLGLPLPTAHPDSSDPRLHDSPPNPLEQTMSNQDQNAPDNPIRRAQEQVEQAMAAANAAIEQAMAASSAAIKAAEQAAQQAVQQAEQAANATMRSPDVPDKD